MKYRDTDGQLKDAVAFKGLSAYDSARMGGYTKSEQEFYEDLGHLASREELIETQTRLEQELNAVASTVTHKVERVRLETDGNHIYYGGTILTFEEVKSLVMNADKIVTLTLDNNVSFLPSAYDGGAIWFDSGFIESGIANQLRVIINEENRVNINQIELADIADINSLDGKITNLQSDIDDIGSYSLTEENPIGTWIDNKPIYRKVYELTDPTVFSKGATFTVSDLPTNFTMMVNGYGIVKTYENAYSNGDILVYSTNTSIMARQNFTGYAEKMWVIVEYVKN